MMKKGISIRWQLVLYDLMILLAVDLLLVVLSGRVLSFEGTLVQMLLGAFWIFLVRIIGNIYGQIWRYGGIQCYIRLIITDGLAFLLTFFSERLCVAEHLEFSRLMGIACMNLLTCLTIRMFYRYAFKCGNETTPQGRLMLKILKLFAGENIVGQRAKEVGKINIAIIGAGRVGVSLSEDLLNNAASSYTPRCFVDVSKEKAGRDIHGIPVLPEDAATLERLQGMGVQEVVGCRDNRTNRKMTLNLGSL